MTKKCVVCLAALLVLTGIGVWSCGPGETPEDEATAEAARVPEPAAQPSPEPEPAPAVQTMPEAEPSVAETAIASAMPDAAQTWEQTVWAAGKEGKLIQGLDGGDYDPYAVATVQQVQQALISRGLYDGPVSGILDQATMQALGEFQKSNDLQECGVPTPRTRDLLLQDLNPET